MAVISFTVPDAQIARVLAAYCAVHGWRDEAQDGTRAAFTRAAIRRDIVGTVRAYERRTAETDAVAAVVVDEVTVS